VFPNLYFVDDLLKSRAMMIKFSFLKNNVQSVFFLNFNDMKYII